MISGVLRDETNRKIHKFSVHFFFANFCKNHIMGRSRLLVSPFVRPSTRFYAEKIRRTVPLAATYLLEKRIPLCQVILPEAWQVSSLLCL